MNKYVNERLKFIEGTRMVKKAKYKLEEKALDGAKRSHIILLPSIICSQGSGVGRSSEACYGVWNKRHQMNSKLDGLS